MSEQKMYLKEDKITIFGKEVTKQKCLFHYKEGETLHYWTNMSDCSILQDKTELDTKNVVFVPIGYSYGNGVFFPSVLKEKGTKKAVLDDNGNVLYDPNTFKSKTLLTLYGFWADDKDGNMKWDNYRNLCSLDFKTWSASNLLEQISTLTKKIDANGNVTTLPMLRIRIKGSKPTNTDAKQLDFEIKVKQNLEFEYVVNQWLEDLEHPIYNREMLERMAQYTPLSQRNTLRFGCSDARKFATIEHIAQFMPQSVERLETNVGDKVGLLLSVNGESSNVVALSQFSEVEEEVDADFFAE